MTIKSAVNKEINLNTRRLQKTMIRQTDHLVNNNYQLWAKREKQLLKVTGEQTKLEETG